MCLLCAMNPDADALSPYDQHLGSGSSSGGSDASNAPYTWDQIAGYLTDGYWGFNGQSWRAFVLDGSRTITYTTSHLSVYGQAIAEYALDVWAAATGITFVNVGAAPVTVNETVDASGSISTSVNITTNTTLNGSIGFMGDADYYRVTLVAGQTYMISMTAAQLGSNVDSILRLLDSSGNVIQTADDPYSWQTGEYITFTATTTGSYYIAATDYGNNHTGSYQITVQTAADLTFNDADSTGAYAWSDLSGNEILRSFINIADDWDDLTLNGYMLQTYIHELGHALGLGHAGPYNGSADWGTDNLYDNDSWSATIMSYFDQLDNTFDPSDYAYLATIMPADLIAIQDLYGAGTTGYATGNSVWGPGGNIGGYFQDMVDMWGGLLPANPLIYDYEPFAFMVYDTGGTDTLNFSVFSQNQVIDLNPLVRSNVGGLIGNVVIARGVVIENATGGSGNDIINGNTLANGLYGNAGNDSLYGGSGGDNLWGGLGADAHYGGDDAGIDYARYDDANYGNLVIRLDNPTLNTGAAAGDSYIGIEGLVAGAGNDVVAGNALANVLLGMGGDDAINGFNGQDSLDGGAGNDTLVGGNHGDTLNGGSGNDLVAYWDAGAGVRADLQAAAVNTGIALGDVYIDIENLAGSNFGDRLGGNALNNYILGYSGNDTIEGRIGNDTLAGGDGNDQLIGGAGADHLDGGTGFDLAGYWDSAVGVRVDIFNLSTNTGTAAGDTYTSIEAFAGTNYDDWMAGTDDANNFNGYSGNDVLTGRGGGDTLNGDAGNDTLIGGAGADTLNGGAGARDLAAYWDSATGLRADLFDPASNTGIAAGDLYSLIEDLAGTNGGDVLGGDNNGNVLIGFGGNDFVNGRGGADSLYGGAGNDTLLGGTGADQFHFNSALGATNVDFLQDFSSVDDTIMLDRAFFAALATGPLAPGAFAAGAAATAAGHRIIYNSATGQIFYDADGNGAGAAILFATVAVGTGVAAGDFLVV